LSLVDDFVRNSGSNAVSRAMLDAPKLLYYDAKNVLVREHHMAP
jgi:hypothetical protein